MEGSAVLRLMSFMGLRFEDIRSFPSTLSILPYRIHKLPRPKLSKLTGRLVVKQTAGEVASTSTGRCSSRIAG